MAPSDDVFQDTIHASILPREEFWRRLSSSLIFASVLTDEQLFEKDQGE